MRWRGRRQSTNVVDRRGEGSSGGGMFRMPGGSRGGFSGSRRASGGMGIGTMIIIGIVLMIFGVNPLTILGQLGGGLGGGTGPSLTPNTSRPPITQNRAAPRSDDDGKKFVSVVLGSTEEIWTGIFKSYGKKYPAPELVLFRGHIRSACGSASSATGPFYCPGDKKVYIDLSFFDQLAKKLGAPGDFAQAYVIAHEVGHHIQNIIGVLPQFNRMRRKVGKIEANKLSVKVELQADCFAGVWGHYVEREGWLDRGDIKEALRAATQIGDDTLQRKAGGRIQPESFNHGTSEQRVEWFSRGIKTGRLESCDTLN